MGYMRLTMGKYQLGIEGEVTWVIPGSYTKTNYACYEDGSNCVVKKDYIDLSNKVTEIKPHLAKDVKEECRNIRG